MDPKHIIAGHRQLTESIAAIEAQQRKMLTPAARIMLEAILLESLTTREVEWRERGKVMLEGFGSERQVAAVVRASFDKVLSVAFLGQPREAVTTRDLLAAVRERWCDIYPIC